MSESCAVGGQSLPLSSGDRRTAGAVGMPAGSTPGEKGGKREHSPRVKDRGDWHGQNRPWKDGRRITQYLGTGKGAETGQGRMVFLSVCCQAPLGPRAHSQGAHILEEERAAPLWQDTGSGQRHVHIGLHGR